ncbi:MAG: Holliday junction resolvase RuvX [Crocinitomicaceae bacterium]|nr:Holliday junction resolvase RuvX [Crocinitomicaceae bacterium]
MGKIIAIDFGLKRTGLAITDDLNMFAFGLDTVDSEKLMDTLKLLVFSEKVDTIVLGLPKRLNNEDAHVTQNIYLLQEAIEKQFRMIKVVLIDERFTSKMASQSMHAAGATKRQKKQKGLVDKVSATIILQSYLSQQ